MPLDFVEVEKQKPVQEFFSSNTNLRPQGLEGEVIPELIRLVGGLRYMLRSGHARRAIINSSFPSLRSGWRCQVREAGVVDGGGLPEEECAHLRP